MHVGAEYEYRGLGSNKRTTKRSLMGCEACLHHPLYPPGNNGRILLINMMILLTQTCVQPQRKDISSEL